MPQFDFANVFLPQFAWLLFFFAVLYFGIVMTTLPRLGKTMDKREGRIRSDILAAEAAKAEADRMALDYEAGIARARDDAREALSAAKAKSAQSVEKKLAAANAKTDAAIAAAEADIAKARAAAMTEIEAVAVDAAQAIVTKLTGTSPAATEARAAVKSALAA
ncbi:MAG: ATPase [Sphingomonadales bacterium]|nr:ATPase [Sphingomonadales bacterium]